MIIAITDRKISAKRDFLEQMEAVAGSSPDMIILREKDISEPEYRYLAVECLRICSYSGVKFCVNSFLRTASAIGCGRVQISFGQLTAEAGALKGFKEIWVSVHSPREALAAEAAGATHLIYGNVFETSCKPGAAGKGVNELRDVCGMVNIPVFAVGGIDLRTAGPAIGAGCSGICVRSLLMGSENPWGEMEELRRICGKRTDGPQNKRQGRILSERD